MFPRDAASTAVFATIGSLPMNVESSRYTFMTTTRYALFVMLICYFPHFATAPWWIFIFVLSMDTVNLGANLSIYT
jgi:hypothetical protein